MKRASQFISAADKEAVERAVAEAERKTSGEIVPVVATASGRYDRAEDIVGVLTALLAVSLTWIYFQEIGPGHGDWAAAHILTLSLLAVLGLFVGGFIAGSAAATYFPSLKLPFLTKKEMQEEVERSAAAAFHRFRLRKTQGSVGVLIYLSLFEHRVRVLADDAIQDKISQSDWEAVRDLIIAGMRKRRPGEGLCQAIAKCGDLLSGSFPIEPGDTNELSNELRLID